MSTESAPSALQRFARDLRRIREQRGISISALSEATQVPQPHIQDFEEGTLYEQSRMNAVYLKAFVRAYAETLEISSNVVVQQLEAALEKEEYNNQLVVQFLEEPPSETADQQSLESESSSSSQRDAGSAPTDDSPETHDTAASESESGAQASSSSEVQDPERAADTGEERQPEDAERDSSSSPSARPQDSSPSRKSASSRPTSKNNSLGRVWEQHGGTVIFVAFIVVVLVIGGGVASFFIGGERGGGSSGPTASAGVTDRSAAPDTNASPDTVEVNTGVTTGATSSQSSRPPANVALGDTFHIVVEATSVVAGMRVRQDDDLRRPYWIEEGEARVFPFTRRITVENQLDSLNLFLENYPYPTTRTNREGQIVISRDTAENFVDTLRGDPATLPTPSDTIPISPAPGPEADTLAQSP